MPAFLRRKNGQGVAEYAIIMALVVLVVVLILSGLGVNLKDVTCKVVRGLGGSGSCGTYCQDDFSNLAGWNASTTTGWKASNNQICVNGVAEQQILNKCSQTNVVPSDYMVSVDIATLTAGSGFGIYFRMQPTPKLNGYIFQYDQGLNGFVFRMWVDDKESGVKASKYFTNYTWYNKPHKIEIKVKGNTYTAYLDGTEVLKLVDSTYLKGSGAGLRSWDSTKACFSGFKVSPIP
jgi:Flp pilus assembly pilin Flp